MSDRLPIYADRVPMEKWDLRFLRLAREVADWSKDPSTGCGAVLVDDLNRVVGLGFNGFPRGVRDDERLHDRPMKYEVIVHAEVNACLQAGHRAEGATLYVWPSFAVPPICARCAGVAIQAGVKKIVGLMPEQRERSERWAESIAIARGMWEEAGLQISMYPTTAID